VPVRRRPRQEHAPEQGGLDARHGHYDLENPRYTGRQVWNRQRTDTELADPADVTLGHKSVPRWNLPDG